VPTGMSIWTFPGDMRDFLRPATDAMTDEEGARGGRVGEGAPGERRRDEEERETESLVREAATSVDGPFHTPTFSFIFLRYRSPAGHLPFLVPRSPHRDPPLASPHGLSARTRLVFCLYIK